MKVKQHGGLSVFRTALSHVDSLLFPPCLRLRDIAYSHRRSAVSVPSRSVLKLSESFSLSFSFLFNYLPFFGRAVSAGSL